MNRFVLTGMFILIVVSSSIVCSRATSNTLNQDGGAIQDSGTYHQGAYTCCGEGRGLSCCAADMGLLGYDVASDGTITPVGDTSLGQANCFHYGGVLGACAPQGHSFDRKEICSLCCAGLAEVGAVAPDDGGTCVPSAGASVAFCFPCGNGVCDPGENKCNCPADCK